jgi:hypothetical protein
MSNELVNGVAVEVKKVRKQIRKEIVKLGCIVSSKLPKAKLHQYTGMLYILRPRAFDFVPSWAQAKKELPELCAVHGTDLSEVFASSKQYCEDHEVPFDSDYENRLVQGRVLDVNRVGELAALSGQSVIKLSRTRSCITKDYEHFELLDLWIEPTAGITVGERAGCGCKKFSLTLEQHLKDNIANVVEALDPAKAELLRTLKARKSPKAAAFAVHFIRNLPLGSISQLEAQGLVHPNAFKTDLIVLCHGHYTNFTEIVSATGTVTGQ